MQITSTANPRIKQVRLLHAKKHRDREGLFLIEGTKLLQEALRSGIRLHSLFYTGACDEPQLQLAPEAFRVPPALMESMTTLPSPPTVLAVAHQSFSRVDPPAEGLQLAADGLQDPGNFGALLRLAEAMGVRLIWVTQGSPDIFHPKVLRGAMGSSFRQPVLPLDWDRWQAMKQAGWCFAATAPLGGQSLFQYRFQRKTCLLLGSEGQGLSEELAQWADTFLTIPLAPGIESLNVTISCAMMVYEYARQYPPA